MIKSFKFGRALLAGLLATISMTVLMYGWPLVGLPSMDIVAALGGVFPLEVSPYVVGSLVHIGIGVSLALGYALFFGRWLPGPGWLRGALFSFIPWLFAITLLGPSLQIASDLFKGKEAVAANPCAVGPANPCAASASNPCAVKAGPCAAANPCGTTDASPNGPSPQVMSLLAHLFYGVVLGAAYRPSGG